jgi:hypothetical protein
VLDLKSDTKNMPSLIRREPVENEATGSLVVIYVLAEVTFFQPERVRW